MRGLIVGALALVVFGCAEDPEESKPDAVARDPADMRVVRLDMAVVEDAAVDGATPDGDPADVAVVDAAADAAPLAACANGLDDDGDARVDADDPGCTGPEDDDEFNPPPAGACEDRQDNDGDGLIDLFDPDCSSEADPSEGGGNPVTECSDGLDNDANGSADWPLDPGCHSAGDVTEGALEVAECANDADDDGDGRTDYPDDPGCGGRGDRDEGDPEVPAACANGVDDDGNGLTDWPQDPGCDAAGDALEEGPCGEGVEVIDLNAHFAENLFYNGTLEGAPALGQGSCGGAAGGERYFVYRVDRPLEVLRFSTNHVETQVPTVLYLRSSCRGPADQQCDRGTADRPGRTLEIPHPAPGIYFLVVDQGARDRVGAFRLTVDAVGPPHCRDQEDNDGDGLVDVADVGCSEADDPDETDPPVAPLCADGLDNDMDGATDYPADADCVAAGAEREAPLCPLPVGAVVEVGQAGGNIELPIVERGPGVAAGACEAGPSPEVVVVLTLDEPSDVFVDILDGQVRVQTPIYIRRVCEDAGSEVICRRGAEMGPLSAIGLDRGTYFVFVEQGFAAPATPRTANIVVRSNIRACNNLLDDDEDGRLDRDDPGCTEGLDDSEIDEPQVPECADGLDNDADGQTDYPNDDGCLAAGDADEAPFCMLLRDVVQVPPQGGRFNTNTNGRENLYEATCGARAAGGELAFAVRVAQATRMTAEMVQADYDTVLFVRAVCDDAATELACDDDGGNGVQSLLNVNLQPGSYFLFVDGFGGGAGTGVLQISFQ